MREFSDTIAAIATPPGNGGVGILRISGPDTGKVLAALFNNAMRARRQPRRMISGRLLDSEGRELDRPLAVWFPAPFSYTGEDVAELHCHGGAGLMREALALAVAAGARPAGRGEFTQRSFLNGRMDLAQAEAVLALIEAQSSAAARLAALQLQGALSRQIQRLSARLQSLLADISAAVDFPDEVDEPTEQVLSQGLLAARAEIDALLSTAERGRMLREGRAIVIIGPANAGKSSLFNALLGRERAIVTAEPGATRDALEAGLELEGLPLSLWDTAGFRQAEQQAERLGIEHSRAAMNEAALILLTVDAAAPWQPQIDELLAECADIRRLLLLNKTDIATPQQIAAQTARLAAAAPGQRPLLISAKTGAGLPELRQAIARALDEQADSAELPLLSEARHQQALVEAGRAIDQAIDSLNRSQPLDLAAIDIEEALEALAAINGHNVSEAVLSEIFARFCVGK